MKAAGAGVVILRLTGGAHRKTPHGRTGPVIGKGLDDAVTRAALNTGCKRIAVAAIVRIEYFLEAIGAGGEIRQHNGRTPVGHRAGRNHEVMFRLGRNPTGAAPMDSGRWPDLRIEPGQKTLQRLWRAFDFQRNAGAGIADKTAELLARGQPMHERAKSYALHGACHV